MAYRCIQDNVAASTSLAQLSDFGERLYWRLLSQTDQWGRLPGDVVKIRVVAVPLLAVSDSTITEALEELVRANRIELYCVAGVWTCQLVDFEKHQPASRMRRAASRFPAPPASDSRTQSEKSLQKPRSADRTRHEAKRSFLTANGPLDVAELPLKSESESESSSNGPPRFHEYDLVELSRHLRGGDERTPFVLELVLRGMPEAALASALEQLEHRREKPPRIESEARYLVGTLTTMRREGQYA